MAGWLKRIRGAIGIGLTWGAGWAVGGVLIGVASILLPWLPWDGFFRVFDAPLPALAVPGFFAGMLFSVVLGVAGRNRRFDELSMPRFAAWGAAGGLLLSLLPAALVFLGLASLEGGTFGLWQLTAVIAGPLTLFSAASAAGSLWLARKAEARALPPGELRSSELTIERGGGTRGTGHGVRGTEHRAQSTESVLGRRSQA